MPGNLQAVRGLVRAKPRTGKDLVERHSRLTDHLRKRRRIGAIRPLPVGSDDVGSRGESHQETGRRLHEGKPLGNRLAGGAERIIPRHVGDDHAHLCRAALEGADEIGEAKALDRDVHVALDAGIDRQQIIIAFELNAVAGQIDHHRGAGLQVLSLVEEVADEAAQIAGAKIATLDDLEPGAGERLGDQAGIVDGGRKRARPIGALPDDQCETILSRRHRRLAENGRQGKATKTITRFR